MIAVARPNKAVNAVAEEPKEKFFGVVVKDNRESYSFHMRKGQWPYAEGEPVIAVDGATPSAVLTEIRRKARESNITTIATLRFDE